MYIRLVLAAFFMLGCNALAADVDPVRVSALRCEHLENPIGIGALQPRLSWKIVSNRVGEVQTAYRICAATSAAELEAGNSDLWDSGKISSDQSVLVPWGGKALSSRSQVFWRVQIWDKDNRPSLWSESAI
jgi:alpha-L-rhamnosidase